jgi:hypothetical protein
MENEIKKAEKKVEFKTYGTKSALLEGIMKNRGKNFMITSEVRDRETGELIDTEHKIVYEKYVDSDMQYIIEKYDDNLVYYPESNKNIVIIMKEVKPNVDDDIFTVKTAKGSTKRQPISMN